MDVEHRGRDFKQNAGKMCIVTSDVDVTYKLIVNYCSDAQLRSGCMECGQNKCSYCAAGTRILVNDNKFIEVQIDIC